MAYLKNKHLANIKKWELDLSKYEDEFYYGYLQAPKDIKEFKGFEELFGFEIKEVRGSLSFRQCTSLTSVSNLPDRVGGLDFDFCTSLTSISNLPDYVGSYLDFEGCKHLTFLPNLPEIIEGVLYFNECTSLTSIEKMPSVVKKIIHTRDCPLFESMNEKEIREKYGISYK